MWRKPFQFVALMLVGITLSACYVVQPQPGTNVVIQNPTR